MRFRPPIEPSLVRVYPNRDTWLASRSSGQRIGGSDVARILGRSSYGGPWSLWKERWDEARGQLRQRKDTPRMQRGRDFEAPVLNLYGRDFQTAVYQLRAIYAPEYPAAEVVFEHPTYRWATATPDAVALDIGQAATWIGVEAKTSADPDAWGAAQPIVCWSAESAALVPVTYALQCYWYLEVTGLDHWDLVVLIIDRELEIRRYRIHRDPAVQNRLLASVAEWRERHLVQWEPPPISSEIECRDWIGSRFPASAELREAKAHERAKIAELVGLRERIKEAEARAASLEVELLDSIGSAGGIILQGADKAHKVRAKVARRICVAGYDVAPIPARHQDGYSYLKLPQHDKKGPRE